MHKKKNLLEKIVKKDYNNELEKVLETKQFDEHVKSTLLSILYKIEAAYKDLETVKKDVQTKEEYVANIIEIIKNNCDSIKIIRMNDEENKIPNNISTKWINRKHAFHTIKSRSSLSRSKWSHIRYPRSTPILWF